MTLLETVTKAAAAAADGDLAAISKLPIIADAAAAAAAAAALATADSPSPAALATRLSGWTISPADSRLADLSAHFSAALRKKLKRYRSLSKDKLFSLLHSFLSNSADAAQLPLDLPPSDDTAFARLAFEKFSFLIDPQVAALIAQAALILELWDVLEVLIVNKLVGKSNSINLVEKLGEKNRADLLCLYAKHAPDLRASELASMLKFFLSPATDSFDSLIAVRKAWESEALVAMEKATGRGIPKKVSILAREAAILLVVAHDRFSSAEICLHYVFGGSPSNLDPLVLASAVARLDGSEVVALVRYFMKWLEKYRRFPEVAPCPSGGAVLGLKACESVPSLEAVVWGIGLLLDEHFSYLVLNSEFHAELRAMGEVVSSLASEAESCCRVDNIVKHLQSKVKENRNS